MSTTPLAPRPVEDVVFAYHDDADLLEGLRLPDDVEDGLAAGAGQIEHCHDEIEGILDVDLQTVVGRGCCKDHHIHAVEQVFALHHNRNQVL
jgi:hypothetical protein